MQLIVLIVAALLLTACASTRVPADHVARVEPVSGEITCMAECLDDASETCESCASDCLDRPSTARVASGE